MSRSIVVIGAPCATAARPPTTISSTLPNAGEAISKLLEDRERAIALLEPLLRRQRQHVDLVVHVTTLPQVLAGRIEHGIGELGVARRARQHERTDQRRR